MLAMRMFFWDAWPEPPPPGGVPIGTLLTLGAGRVLILVIRYFADGGV